MGGAQGSLPEAFVAAFNARDGAAMRELVTDDVEIHPLRSIVEDVVYRGAEDIDRWVADLAESWDYLRIDIEEVDDHEGGVQFVVGRVKASTHLGGPLTEAKVYWIAWVRDDLLSKLVTATDRERAEAIFREAASA